MLGLRPYGVDARSLESSGGRMITVKRFVAVCMFVILWVNLAHTGRADVTSAQKIMDGVFSVYASCDTYADEGQVRTVFLEKSERRIVIKPFKTAFARPGRFRFEFKLRRGDEGWDRFIAWQQDGTVRSWSAFDKRVKGEEWLPAVLVKFTGISNKAALTIPLLLMPDLLKARSLSSLTGLRLDGEEKIDGRPAYRVKGEYPRNNTATVWVDKEKLLVLRIHERKQINDIEVEQTTDYRPRINVEVSAEDLAFNAPGS
jgi:hypothetical protein